VSIHNLHAPDPNLYSEFLASITHEFRTPLAGLQASIELLQADFRYLTAHEMDELLGSMHLSVSSLQTLVDNLLESARIESGHFSLTRRSVRLNDILSESIQIMQPLIDRRQQALTLAQPLVVPMVQADPIRMIQVMVNLLSNACSYSPLGANIDIQVEHDAEHVRVSVQDRGMGIPDAIQAQLFQRFERHDVDGVNESGVGLGLAVVKAIIDGHGGQVGAESRAGGGSVFWFMLPL
jgi:signal transduction histidine kinase